MPKLRWVLLSTIAVVFLTITLTAYVTEFQRMARLTHAVDRKMTELVRLSRTIQEMEEQVSFYGTREGLARLAREQFNLVRPGERIYRLEVVSPDEALPH
ncbi:MAG: septum formation initiator family protein [Synergistales bacterium]|jgi:cell division protein FtsB|nr:septum formation initiator family protein [Synergistales bacterium]